MASSKHNRTPSIVELLPELVRTGLAGDRSGVENVTATAIRLLRATEPESAARLAEILGAASVGSSSVRWNSAEPPPADGESGASLVRIVTPDSALAPVLPGELARLIDGFLNERRASTRLLAEGILPPRSLLLTGAPGTGKTMLARWLADQLKVKLVVLDLASAMSSYLGRTGSNLRRSLDFARAQPCVFFLDEFDAIAKRRDDATEVGELKRIVNVLLKELEEWPVQSVLVAATNHPELLDPAIARRFDIVLDLPNPDDARRLLILQQTSGRFAATLPAGFLPALAQMTDGLSGSALVTLAQSAIRRHVVSGTPLVQTLVEQAMEVAKSDPERIGEIARALTDNAGMSVREVAAILGKGSSTIQYHLTKPALRNSHGTPRKTAHSRQRRGIRKTG